MELLASSSYREAQPHVEPCSKDLMLPFVTMMHYVLPREVRDMIYGHLLSSVVSGSPTITIRRAWKTAVGNGMYCPGEHRWISKKLTVDGQCLCFPHIIRPEYVGLEVAREIVEAWYKRDAEYGGQLFAVNGFNRRKIERMVCEDVFSVKLDPTTVIQALTLRCLITELAIGTKKDGFSTATARQQVLGPLYRIKNKSGFDLDVSVSQRHIRLNLWHDICDTFKPVLEHFENAGANIRICFNYYGHRDGYESVLIVLNDLIRDHDPATWKCGVIEQLEQVCLA
jgi:hypothetical protein